MDRRKFLGRAGCLLGSSAWISGEERRVRVRVDTGKPLGAIPGDFLGLGYEISSVAREGLLSATNRGYVELVRTLGPRGTIRVGGNTSDYSSFSREGRAVSAPKGTVVNAANLRELGAFLGATGWQLIWGLNLGGGTAAEAAEDAEAVAEAAGEKLLAFEIGNEPDLFGRTKAHRAEEYGYEDYREEYRRYKAAIRARLPKAQFAGPDAASAGAWVSRFAADEGKDLRLLTRHYYRECANAGSTFDKLLQPDPKLGPELEEVRAASMSSGVPYRICETNSFCGGGKPGVSDRFGAALWVLDYMHTLAAAGAAGVNIETGVNQLGFISSYSPIGDDERGAYWAAPEYYGMLAFAYGGRGERVALDCDAAGMNLTAYAVAGSDKRLRVTVVNKDRSLDAQVRVAAGAGFRRAHAMRLSAASIESKDGVTLGGARVGADGMWKAAQREELRVRDGGCDVGIPAASAAVVVFEA